MEDDLISRLRMVMVRHMGIVEFCNGSVKADTMHTIDTMILAIGEVESMRLELDAVKGMMSEFKSIANGLAHALIEAKSVGAVIPDSKSIDDYLRIMESSESSH
jgi:hypothetical protein